jgi:hypothetical protein
VIHEYPCRGPLFGQAHFTVLADSQSLQTTLRRCDTCSSLWETMEKTAWLVSADTAARDFPELVLDEGGSE